jgi:AraC-like DNA-binding protein
MQIQSSLPVEYLPYSLSSDFPVYKFDSVYKLKSGSLKKLHYHNHIELGSCLKGSGLFYIDNKILPFKEGDTTLIFPDQLHFARSFENDPSEWLFVYIEPISLLMYNGFSDLEKIKYLLTNHIGISGIINKDKHDKLNQLIKNIISEIRCVKAYNKEITAALVWEFLLTEARESENYTKRTSFNYNSSLTKILPALSEIINHYNESLTIAYLAKICSLSESHFRRVFRKETDKSPQDYLLDIRIKTACMLLENTDLPITEICFKSGFSTPSGFNRQFIKLMKMTPRAFRKKLN